jgi:hypothetical protein
MKGDFTRNTFNPKKHYRDVLLQQGRVQVDADWNEQAELTARRDETTAADIIGDCGGPADNAAFAVFTDPSKLSAAEAQHLQNLNITTPLAGGDFFLSAGRYYVDGIQCENEWPIPFSAQPDRRGVGPLDAGAYLLYLDVWQRHLTALEDSSIREPALGGPDHGTRAKTIWQVRVLNFGSAGASETDNPCGLGADLFSNLADPGTAKLTAGTAAQQAPKDPCLIPASAGYTGLENQLYRVEIHGPGGAVFSASNVAGDAEVTILGESSALRPRRAMIWKWSRENGSVVTRVEKIDGNKITVSSLGPDKNLGFAKDAWVEILDDALELESKPGQLAQIDDVDEATRIITLKTAVSSLAPSNPNYPNGIMPELHPELRRWEGVASIQFGTWLPLESGVQVNFATGNYRTGDYWQIPARTATAQSPTGDIEWPLDAAGNPAALSPFGITHHFCRLGIVDVKGDGSIEATDCRCLWPALTSVPRLFYVSGDGQEVMPAPPSSNNLYKLPNPLIVGVANAHCLKQPAMVHFYVSAGGGLVAPQGGVPASFAKIPTDAAGLAHCDFYLDGAAGHSQQVTAILLDANGNPVWMTPLIFNANLSIAREVAYDPGEDCAALQGQRTVQDAIARLASLARLEAVGGDGQDAEPGAVLANPIQVLVTSSCGPVAGATVNFDKGGNQGIVTPPSVITGADGLATCHWKPDPDPALPTQELTVTLVLPNNIPISQPATLRFTANVRHGKGCCVTVGQGGEFVTLEAAITTLVGRNLKEICICLLPGDHQVSELVIVGTTANALPTTGGRTPDGLPLEVETTAKAAGTNVGTPPPIVLRHLHIHGCGRASRILLENQFTAQNLSSINLQDLCIYADKAQDRPIYIKDCDDVTITGCHVRNQDTDNIAPADLVIIHHEINPNEPPRQRRTYIANNVIECEGSVSGIIIDPTLVAPAGGMPADAQMAVESTVSNLASKSKSQRAAFVKKFRKIVKGTPKSDPNKQALEAALKRVAATPRSAKESKAASPSLESGDAAITPALPLATTPEALAVAVIGPPVILPTRPIFGPALVIADANADASIINNIIKGDVRFYGTTGGAHIRQTFDDVAEFFHRTGYSSLGTEAKPGGGTLRIEGNSLTKVMVDKLIDPTALQAGLAVVFFSRMSILDNTFHSDGSQWLAIHVISKCNRFILPGMTSNAGPIVASAVAGSFICVGTSSTWPFSILKYAVPPTFNLNNKSFVFFNESANLFIELKRFF